VINATRPAITRALTTSIRKLVVGPSPLAEIEQHLSVGDPTLVRGAIFDIVDESKCRTAWCQRPIGESLSGVRLLLFLSAQ